MASKCTTVAGYIWQWLPYWLWWHRSSKMHTLAHSPSPLPAWLNAKRTLVQQTVFVRNLYGTSESKLELMSHGTPIRIPERLDSTANSHHHKVNAAAGQTKPKAVNQDAEENKLPCRCCKMPWLNLVFFVVYHFFFVLLFLVRLLYVCMNGCPASILACCLGNGIPNRCKP